MRQNNLPNTKERDQTLTQKIKKRVRKRIVIGRHMPKEPEAQLLTKK